MAYIPVGWADSPATTTPVDSADLSHMDAGITAVDVRIIGTPATNEQFGYGLRGSTHVGITSPTNVVEITSGSSNGVTLKQNNYYDGTNDRFMNASAAASQVKLGAAGVFEIRTSTNTPAADAIITWGSFASLTVVGAHSTSAFTLSAGAGAPGALATGEVYFQLS